jgi:hypothetical protein
MVCVADKLTRLLKTYGVYLALASLLERARRFCAAFVENWVTQDLARHVY